MLDDVTFPVYRCVACRCDVLAAHELTPDDELVPVCTRCGGRLDEDGGRPRMLGATALGPLGYEVEGSGDGGGCGGGGCSACGSSTSC
jgi:DNA-directed RNA polymerase subunit RPC12/RpoP